MFADAPLLLIISSSVWKMVQGILVQADQFFNNDERIIVLKYHEKKVALYFRCVLGLPFLCTKGQCSFHLQLIYMIVC